LTSEIDNWVRALFMPEALRLLLEQRSAEGGLLRTAELILIEVLVFPVALELLFRGIVQPVLVERFGPVRGIASTGAVEIGAALLTTLSPYGKLEAFAAALLLGALRHSTGSLLPALALRSLMGAATVAAGYGVFGIPGFDDLDAAHTPAHWLLGGALCVSLGLWLCARMGRYRQSTGA
jgi:membrane protease YdiL (CAAX protease family)